MTMSTPILAAGRNDTPIWGMTAHERLRRLAAAERLLLVETAPAGGSVIVADLGHAFDPLWLRYVAARPGTVVTSGGRAALAHVDARQAAEAVAGAVPPGVTVLAIEDEPEIENESLRKRQVPFLLPLTPATTRAIERASYKGAYKGVTDLLTKYLWPELAFHLTRAAASLRLTPNFITVVGIALCIAATFAFWDGRYWLGLALGFAFMVLDTVDGKLARCTITASRVGDVLDHGADLVHPPFWWWAWAHGLTAYGLPLDDRTEAWVLWTIIAGYVVQRAIEGLFITAFGMHIHVWQRIDSWFRLITARRNPNVVILVACLAFGRPDTGLIAVAWWTVLSCLFHAVRVAQAAVARARGGPLVSWLS